MTETPSNNAIIIDVPYRDEHLIEVRCAFKYGQWSGATTAYCSDEDLSEFVRVLNAFVDELQGQAELSIGADNGVGLVGLRFYTINRMAHIACQIRLASMESTEGRPERIATMSIEVKTDRASIDRFVEELRTLQARKQGTAQLACI